MTFNFNNQRMGFGSNNGNNQNQVVKPNFGARSIDSIKDEMNNLKYNHGLSKKEEKIIDKPENSVTNHQERVNAIKQINGFNKKF